MNETDFVYVVDDDAVVLDSLSALLQTEGYQTMPFSSAAAFLAHGAPRSGCLILDLMMPEMNGLDLQRRLAEEASLLPVILITAHGEVRAAVEAMKLGAVDFIEKPIDDELLLKTVNEAMTHGREARERSRVVKIAKERIQLLSPREREIITLVVRGDPSRAIGERLGISRRTVEIHRMNIMRKLQVENLAEMVRLAHDAGVGRPETS